MATFTKNPTKQARSLVNELRKTNILPSIRSGHNYFERYEIIAKNLTDWGLPTIRNLDPAKCVNYLERRGQEVGDSTLRMEKLALQYALQLTGQLKEKETLPPVESELDQTLKSRFYTGEQVKLIAEHQTEPNQLATQIAHAAGFRAHELLTLLPANERAPDKRPALPTKFNGRDGVLYTVDGKGGLIRHVLIPHVLAQKLESLRLAEPVKVIDRKIEYTQHYAISGGHKWSSSFTKASNRACGWSRGAHGVRHSYAQERMRELAKLGYDYKAALETVSQEMGHFRPGITETYLR